MGSRLVRGLHKSVQASLRSEQKVRRRQSQRLGEGLQGGSKLGMFKEQKESQCDCNTVKQEEKGWSK